MSDFWAYPDCTTPSGARFYGMYKGQSTLHDGREIVTQWQVSPGSDVSKLCFSKDFEINLSVTDTRAFTVNDRSFMGNDLYIRSESSKGLFMDDSLTMEFWMDEGVSVEPGEPLYHYVYRGKKR